MKQRTVRIKPDGTIIALHTDDIDFEPIGEVDINRATDVYYEKGAGWRARIIHPALDLGEAKTLPRKNRKDAINDEEVILNEALDHGLVVLDLV